jgi:hypothetical protein
MKRIPITEEEFRVLYGNPEWRITEIPQERIGQIPHLPRPDDVIGVYTSGDLNGPKILNGISSVLGMDVIAQETNPNVGKNEPELNIYHVVVQKLENPIQDFQYLMHVAYRDETLAGHWRSADALDEYIQQPQARFGQFFNTTGIAPQVSL